MAVIVPRDPAAADSAEYLGFCDDKLARFKIPKHVMITDELPRNAAGKVLKRELKEAVA